MTNEKKVLIYSTPTCGFCNMAKDYFKEKNVEFEEVDVSQDQEAAENMVKKSGQMGVPQIYIGETLIIGFDKDTIDKELGLS